MIVYQCTKCNFESFKNSFVFDIKTKECLCPKCNNNAISVGWGRKPAEQVPNPLKGLRITLKPVIRSLI